MANQTTNTITSIMTYFNENKSSYKFYELSLYNEHCVSIYKSAGFLINFRVKCGLLKDINLYISGKQAKHIFDILKSKKEELENLLGYNLVWDYNYNKEATRIGRFFLDAKLAQGFESENKNMCYNFNVNHTNYAQKTIKELVHFNNVMLSFLKELNLI